MHVAKELSTSPADYQGSACVLASLDGGDPTAVTAPAFQASERAFQDVLQLGAVASDRQRDSGGLMLDGERLAPRRTCLEHTALVADAAARTVDVAQRDLDAGESGIESIDCPGQNLFEPFALCIGQRNVAVSVDEDLDRKSTRLNSSH